jgi:hypothetical protein
MAVKYETEVPIPGFATGRKQSELYKVLEECPVGFSFFYAVDGEDPAFHQKRASQIARRIGSRVVTRRVTEDGVSGIRIWRVE